MRTLIALLIAALVVVGAGCSDTVGGRDGDGGVGDSGVRDAAAADSGAGDTGGGGHDAGAGDANHADQGSLDAGGGDANHDTSPPVGEILPLPTAITTYYVSSSLGNDSWSGTLPDPNGGGSDGPKATLSAALSVLNGAAPGTHVLLRKGDSWTPSTPLVVSAATGTEQDPVVLGSYGAGAQPSIVAQYSGTVVTIRSNAGGPSAYFRMDDLRLTTSQASDGQLGMFIGEGWHPEVPHHITLSGLTIENNGGGITMYGDHHRVHGCRVANNVFGQGIYVNGDDVSFRYNEFENNGLPPPDLFVHSLYISHCDGVVFEHNEVHSATDGVKVRKSHNGVFRHNTFHDLEVIGIHLGGDSEGGTRNNRIESNLFYRNGSGIVIKSESGTQTDLVDGLVIANNILHSGRESFADSRYHIAVTSVPARNVAVVNNLVYEIGDNDNGIRIDNAGDNILCANNIVGKFSAGTTYALAASVTESGNLEYTTLPGFATLNLSDPASFDFTPTADSTLLIDTGIDASSVLTADYDGTPRPAGTGFDIGPFEYVP